MSCINDFSLLLEHQIFVGFNVIDVNPIPFLLTLRVSRQEVITNVREEEASFDVCGVAIGVGELVMNSMCSNPVIDSELQNLWIRILFFMIRGKTF